MSLYSRTAGPALQRNAEDLAALAGERCDADPRERELLAELQRLQMYSLPVREIVHKERRILAELVALNAREDADHVEALHISRLLAGEFEALNREQYEASKKEAAGLLSTDRRQGPDTDEHQCSTGEEQLPLFQEVA